MLLISRVEICSLNNPPVALSTVSNPLVGLAICLVDSVLILLSLDRLIEENKVFFLELLLLLASSNRAKGGSVLGSRSHHQEPKIPDSQRRRLRLHDEVLLHRLSSAGVSQSSTPSFSSGTKFNIGFPFASGEPINCWGLVATSQLLQRLLLWEVEAK